MKLLPIIILILLSSCRLILGIKEPKQKTTQQLNRYLVKKHIDTLNCYTFTKQAFDSVRNTPFKPKWEKGFRPIQFKVFDRAGKLVSQYASCEGSWKKKKIFDSYPPKNSWPLDTTALCSEDIKMYRSYYGQKVEMPDADLHIVVYWASWLGLINKNLVKALYKYKAAHPDKKIDIIKVNVVELYPPDYF